jgi:hypothetical protein
LFLDPYASDNSFCLGNHKIVLKFPWTRGTTVRIVLIKDVLYGGVVCMLALTKVTLLQFRHGCEPKEKKTDVVMVCCVERLLSRLKRILPPFATDPEG